MNESSETLNGAGRGVCSADEFVRRVREAHAVEVKGSLWVKDEAMMYLLDPHTSTAPEVEWMVPDEAPLYVVCHRSRAAEVRDVVSKIRLPREIDAIVRALAASVATPTHSEVGPHV